MYRDSSSVPGEEDSKKLETFPRLPLRQLAPDIPQYVIAWALSMVPFISLKPHPPSIHSFLKSSISLSTFMAVAPRSLSLAGDARRRYIAPIWTTYRIGPSVDHQLAQALQSSSRMHPLGFPIGNSDPSDPAVWSADTRGIPISELASR